MKKNLVAYCGLYCGACSFKVAYEVNNNKHLMNMPTKFDEYKNMPLQSCPGCKSDNECGDCQIKSCAESKELEHCGLCKEFPCEIIINFNNDGIPHHGESLENLKQLKSIGIEQWVKQQDEKWTCNCGEKLSWYFKKCDLCQLLDK